MVHAYDTLCHCAAQGEILVDKEKQLILTLRPLQAGVAAPLSV